MFFVTLAFAAQATVATPQGQDAMRCASAAVVAANPGEAPIRTTSHFMYFAMQATQAEAGDAPFLERLGTIAASAGEQTPPSLAEAKTRIVDCDRRFPLARTNATPRLPAAEFDRDVMCLGVLSLLQGAAEAMQEAGQDGSAADKVRAALDPISARLTDEALAARGMTSEDQFVRVMGDQVRATLALGDPASVARACGAAI